MSYETRETQRLWEAVKSHIPRKDTPLKMLYIFIWSYLIFNGYFEPSDNKIFDLGMISVGMMGLIILLGKPIIKKNKLLSAQCLTDISLAPWCSQAKQELKIRINRSDNNLKLKDLIAILKIQKQYDTNITQKENSIIKQEAFNKIMNDS